ncbi:MAG: response regulator transcription factor [Chloroflexota bacterium]
MAAKIRILIADDHAVLREGMRDILSREKDFEVAGEARDGQEAVELAKELKPDVVVMDIVMPRLTGVEATRLVKEVSPSSAVLILTGYSDIRYILGLLEAGACGYLLKSSRSSEVVDAIRTVRSGESVLDPVVTRKLLQRVMGASSTPKTNGTNSELTSRELEILRAAAKGMSNKDIASALFVSLRTVKAHLTNIFNKMGCGSRTDAIIKGLKQGYITLDDIQRDGEGE